MKKISVDVLAENGENLVNYRYYERGHKKPITPRKPALPPCEIHTNEELYINGKHLEQYKHFAYEPAVITLKRSNAMMETAAATRRWAISG